MKKSYLIIVILTTIFSSALADGTPSHDKYIVGDCDEAGWYEAYSALNILEIGSKALYEGISDEATEDENFYISRIKPRDRFNFTGTQVKENLDPNRKLLWWCPMGNTGWNAIPTAFFDSEVFSAWSYLDTYGNWTAEFVRMPGAMTDICHKNGVKTSVLANVAWASTITESDGSHGSNFAAMIDGGYEKFLKYLRYYGIDGIGFNSVFTFDPVSFGTEMKEFLGALSSNKDEYEWPTYHNCWSSYMSNSNIVGGASFLSSGNSDWFDYNGLVTSNTYFTNYGFTATTLGYSQSTAESFSRSSFDVYAGINLQDGSSVSLTTLQDYDISIGVWGGYSENVIYDARSENGAASKTRQSTYQKISDNLFTGSTYNPVNTLDINGSIIVSSSAVSLSGFSSFITARSSLTTTDLATDPFVTYFNLGNGEFFNIEGETTHNNEWYNIGMQDYLPTWRWWWTKSYLGKDADDASTDMSAQFTWDDAWFGGSSLEISGATTTSYLQLFKTKYETASRGDILSIRYKITAGEGSISWACSTESDVTTEVSSPIATDAKSSNNWIMVETPIGWGANALAISGETVAQIGLKFSNTSSDFKVIIGEMSLTRGTSTTPNAPIITLSKSLDYNYKGYGMKIIFEMESNKTSNDEPVYNSDVDTWFFKVYAQQEGCEPTVVGATTSWAAYQLYIDYDESVGGKTRMGVSAVSLDGDSESEISWGEYQELETYVISEGFTRDKDIIKPNEEFSVCFDDQKHADATWRVFETYDKTEMINITGTGFTTSIDEVGIYDLEITQSDGEVELYRGFIQISPVHVGGVPNITSFTAETNDKSVKLQYTHNEPNGEVSQGLKLPSKAYTIPAEQLAFSSSSEFSLAFWFYAEEFIGSTQLLNIREVDGDWPASDWGYIWSTIDEDGKFALSFRSAYGGAEYNDLSDYIFCEKTWYHVVFALNYNQLRGVKYYVNGELIADVTTSESIYPWLQTNAIMIGGSAYDRNAFSGYIDDFQLYNTALTETEAARAMLGEFTADDMPENLIGYWDFEDSNTGDMEFTSKGQDESLVSGVYETTFLSFDSPSTLYTLVTPIYSIGSPFVGGNYTISTDAVWGYTGAVATTSMLKSNDGDENSIDITYTEDGSYLASITLTNSYGSDTESLSIEIVSTTGIEDVTLEEMMAYPNPFTENLYVNFTENGKYTIEIYNAAGMLTTSSAVTAIAGSPINISVNGDAGIYFVKIKDGDTLLKVMKVIKK